MNDRPLIISVLSDRFGICRLAPNMPLPAWAIAGPFYSITRTTEELSVVCPELAIPDEIVSEKGWRCLKIHGPLDFSLIGILSSLTIPLTKAGISIFAISTYDTDYLLVQETELEKAKAALREAGH